MTLFPRVARALLLAALFASPLAAQDPSAAAEATPDQPVRRDPLGTRLINTATPYSVASHTLEVMFIHRFRQAIQDGDSHNLWGLDSGADVGIGLAWGLTSRADVALLRSAFQEDYELAGKLLVLEQSARSPVSLAARLGIDHLRREGALDPDRPFAQVVVSHRFTLGNDSGLHVQLAPSWVRDTEQLHNAFNVPIGLSFALPGDRVVEVEIIPKNRDLDGSVTAWHAALSQKVGGHIFEIVLGNSRAMTVDQILGGDFAGGFESGDVRLGFNLIRNFGS